MMTTNLDYENILLRVEFRYGDFKISLRTWVDEELYNEPQFAIRAVHDTDGNELPISIIPSEYRCQKKGSSRGTPLVRPLWLSLTQFFKK